MKKHLQRLIRSMMRLGDGRGASLLIVLCVGIITATAVWTSPDRTPYVSPSPPPSGEQSVSLLMQQTLSKPATPTPLPTTQPELWLTPLPEIDLLRAYSEDKMIRSGVTGVWAIHYGADLKAAYGAPVSAMAAGTIEACGEESLLGTWIQVDHGNGCTTTYAGLSMLAALQPGDKVRAGQTVGFIGNGVISETDLGPHLHLEARRNGVAFDPTEMFAK